MSFDLAFVKQHWHWLAAGFVGLLVLFYLSKQSGAASSSGTSSTDLSSGSNPSLDAAQLMAQASLNGQVETTQIQGQVASEQVAAQLDATNKQTAAEAAVALGGQAEDLAKTQVNDQTAIGLQHIVTTGQVQQTQIEGQTLTTLGATAAQAEVAVEQSRDQVALSQIQDVNNQITTIQKYSKNAGKDYASIAPVIALETGQGGAATGIANANAKVAVSNGTPATIAAAGGAASGIGKVLSGLFS